MSSGYEDIQERSVLHCCIVATCCKGVQPGVSCPSQLVVHSIQGPAHPTQQGRPDTVTARHMQQAAETLYAILVCPHGPPSHVSPSCAATMLEAPARMPAYAQPPQQGVQRDESHKPIQSIQLQRGGLPLPSTEHCDCEPVAVTVFCSHSIPLLSRTDLDAKAHQQRRPCSP